MKFQGSFPALVTPFYENYKINFSNLSQLIEMHNKYSDGLVLLGSTGEGWLLSDLEQKQIVEHVCQSFQGPIIVNITCWNAWHYAQKVELFEHSLDKVQAFLLAAPSYLKLTTAQVINFYAECAQLSPLPIIAYHIPSRNGVTFDSTVFDFLAHEPHIIGVKETVASELKSYGSQYRLALFAGEDSFLAEPFINTSINVLGNLLADIFSACPEQINWHHLAPLMSLANNPLIIKQMMFNHGLIQWPGARPPLGILPPNIREQVKSLSGNLLIKESPIIAAF
jgi:4-hydroxy-tetrahydrodipicolinate synthase